MTDPLASLSLRVRHLLESHGVSSSEQVNAMYPLGLLGIRGFGLKALREVEAAFLASEMRYRPAPGASWSWCSCDRCQRNGMFLP